MQKHTKIYFKEFYPNWGPDDFFECEICLARANDLHHIEARGMGGSKKKDTIDNLMGLCRKHHEEYGDKEQYKDFLKDRHAKWMKWKKEESLW
jgi:hypothetical protein